MNIFKKLFIKETDTQDTTTSLLCNEYSFYDVFLRDLLQAKEEVIIESPYITIKRLKIFVQTFEKLIDRNIKVYILTRDPSEHDMEMAMQAEAGIQYCEEIGIQVLLIKGGHHRKLAMIDRTILWEVLR